MSTTTHPIRGKTLSLTFKDGQMAGKTIDHAFHVDGSLDFFPAEAPEKRSHVDSYEVARVSDDVYAVSYLGSSGYTLSIVLNFADAHLIAFSSNDKMMQMQHGSFAAA